MSTSKEDTHERLLGWYAEHYAALHEYGWAVTGEPDLVADLLQEMFTWLLEHPRTINKVEEPKAYLMRSLHNNIRKYYYGVRRQQGRRDAYQREITELSEPSAEVIMQQKDNTELQQQLVHHCLDQLSPRQREIIYLRYYKSIPYAQIAKMLNIKEQVARNMNSRAIGLLRRVGLTLRDRLPVLPCLIPLLLA